MTIHDELLKQLRDFAVELRKAEDALLVRDAADAIEELSTYADLYKELTDKGQKTARALLDAYPKWIPVTERLPETGEYVLVRYKNNDMAIACIFEHDENFTFWRAMIDEGWCADCDTEPTHWMPLPEPPKEE